ncbi:MAG: endonuclease/exonuclease/phosphatase family protein, partial [Nocardioidaceae bacterium]
MKLGSTRIRRTAVALLAVAALAVPAGPAAAAPSPGQGTPVTVMTRNLYLGGDITRPLAATAGKTGQTALVAFANANYELRSIVDRTDFPARSKLLAKEIATTEPDLVGLQEVALWRHGPFDFVENGRANAETVDYDFLQTLLADLAALGEPYVAVSVQQESDVEGPAFRGPGLDAKDVRLTMRDVILKRVDSGVQVVKHGSGQYDARLPLTLDGATFTFIRGYNWVDVRKGTKRFRLINTHLESQFSFLALAQAEELVAGPAKPSSQPVIIVCDCNSDPLNHTRKPGDPVPHAAPYDFITGPGGFTDEWLRFAPAEQGWTSGLSELVNDVTAAGFNHRIDMVFARGVAGAAMPADKGVIVGADPANRTATGLWPSDHAGVVLRLRP